MLTLCWKIFIGSDPWLENYVLICIVVENDVKTCTYVYEKVCCCDVIFFHFDDVSAYLLLLTFVLLFAKNMLMLKQMLLFLKYMMLLLEQMLMLLKYMMLMTEQMVLLL